MDNVVTDEHLELIGQHLACWSNYYHLVIKDQWP